MEQKVRKGEELNEQNLKAFLYKNELISSENNDLNVVQFATGFSNLTYLLEIENNAFVLRRPPVGAIKRGHDMGREFKVLTGLNKGFDKAPKAHVYCADETVIGASFYIMQKMEGIILSAGEAQKRQIAAQEFPIIADRWLSTLVELHELDYAALGLADLGKPEGYVERQVENWAKQYQKAATEDISVAEKVMQWLNEKQPKTYEHRLIHNDFKYDNVVFKDETWNEIAAVLDWEMCTLGDPLMDFGTSLAYWTMATDHPSIVQGFPSPTSMLGNPSRSDLVELYTQKSGREVDNLVFYYAFGLFKNAVIVQQIYYRYHHGLTTDPRFANLNKATYLFLTMAWQAIQSNSIDNFSSSNN